MRERIDDFFTTRLLIIGGFIFILFLCIIIRLFYLQIIKRDFYVHLAEENRVYGQITPSPRARIIDRKGRVLADNKPIYQAVLLRDQVVDFEGAIETFSKFIPLTALEHKKINKQIQNQPRYLPIVLKRHLSFEEIATLEVNESSVPGVQVVEVYQRSYPLGPMLSHVLGYIGAPNPKEMDQNPDLRFPGATIGKNGMEQYYNDHLKGVHGRREIEINARGKFIRELKIVPSKPDPDLMITIDAELQQYAYERLSAYKSSAAIIMDIQTGEILALVSYPGFDPNLFVDGISHENWRALQDNEVKPLTNKVTAGLYSPASLFKMILGLAAYQKDPALLRQAVVCEGAYKIAGHTFHCWKKKGHGRMDFREAIIHSCDIYFYRLAQILGPHIIAETAEKFGLGVLHDIDLIGERKGVIPTPQWKKKNFSENWYQGDTILLSIGQGSTLTTPLQWAMMMSLIGNGGKMIKPHLRKQEGPSLSPPEINIGPEIQDILLSAMDATVNKPGGTAYQSRITHEGFEMLGKTATSQVRRISMQERLKGIRHGGSLPWRLRDHSMFVGLAPVKNPRYVVAVLVEHGEWGSRIAAPIGRDLLLKTQQLMEAKNEPEAA